MQAGSTVLNEHVSVVCNLCGALDGTVVADRTTSVRTSIGDFEFHVRLVCCEQCGLVFWTPRMTDALLRDYYQAVYRSPLPPSSRDNARRASIRARIDWLSSNGVQSGRLLEIGAGEGFFLERATEAGFQATGLEPSNEYADAALGVASRAHVIRAFLEEYEPAEPFDIVCSFFVLEHSLDATDFLRRCYSFMRPGGYCYLEVPDVSRYPEQTGDMLWHEHTYHFTARTLSRLLARIGFKTVVVSSPGPSYPFGMAVLASRLPQPDADWNRDLPDRVAHDEAVESFAAHAATVAAYREALRDVLAPILSAARSGRVKLAMYGTGVFHDTLYTYADLRSSDISLLIDDNASKWASRTIQGLEVKPPQAQQMSRIDAVVIGSDGFEEQIATRAELLRNAAGSQFEIIRPHSAALERLARRFSR